LKLQTLKSANNTIEEEKRQISAVLDNVTEQMKGLEGNVQQLTKENKILSEKITAASAFNALNVSLLPVTLKNNRERETNDANKVTKLIISFAVQNNIIEETDAEVFVIVTQPDGSVLKSDVWEAFSIDTKSEGKKSYTRKVRFEYEKGERKNLIFSLNADDYMKGNYKLQVYHKGYMIGQTTKMLN